MGKVLVIDYKMGNTDSVLRAVEKCGGEPILSNSISEIRHPPTKIISKTQDGDISER